MVLHGTENCSAVTMDEVYTHTHTHTHRHTHPWVNPHTPQSRRIQKGRSTFTNLCVRQSGWLLSKSLQAVNAGAGVEKREPSYTVGGNAI